MIEALTVSGGRARTAFCRIALSVGPDNESWDLPPESQCWVNSPWRLWVPSLLPLSYLHLIPLSFSGCLVTSLLFPSASLLGWFVCCVFPPLQKLRDAGQITLRLGVFPSRVETCKMLYFLLLCKGCHNRSHRLSELTCVLSQRYCACSCPLWWLV